MALEEPRQDSTPTPAPGQCQIVCMRSASGRRRLAECRAAAAILWLAPGIATCGHEASAAPSGEGIVYEASDLVIDRTSGLCGPVTHRQARDGAVDAPATTWSSKPQARSPFRRICSTLDRTARAWPASIAATTAAAARRRVHRLPAAARRRSRPTPVSAETLGRPWTARRAIRNPPDRRRRSLPAPGAGGLPARPPRASFRSCPGSSPRLPGPRRDPRSR